MLDSIQTAGLAAVALWVLWMQVRGAWIEDDFYESDMQIRRALTEALDRVSSLEARVEQLDWTGSDEEYEKA